MTPFWIYPDCASENSASSGKHLNDESVKRPKRTKRPHKSPGGHKGRIVGLVRFGWNHDGLMPKKCDMLWLPNHLRQYTVREYYPQSNPHRFPSTKQPPRPLQPKPPIFTHKPPIWNQNAQHINQSTTLRSQHQSPRAHRTGRLLCPDPPYRKSCPHLRADPHLQRHAPRQRHRPHPSRPRHGYPMRPPMRPQRPRRSE